MVSLLGDKYSQQNPSKAEEVYRTFKGNQGIIFSGIDFQQTEISLPPIDTRVYPLGRFRQYLSQKRILEQYQQDFEQDLSDYACPDLIEWPGIIVEPNGDLNLCGSFEAINCRNAIVGNIFSKSYEQVQDDLIQLHKIERQWFIDNLPDIVAGKISACKIKNNCYGSRH